jgi:hypothetical protein
MTKRELPGLGTTLESWGLLHSGERSPKMYQPLPGFYPVTHTLWIGTNREGESRYNLRDQGQMRYFSRPGVPLSRHGSPTDQKPFPTVHTRPSPGGGISATLGRISAMKIIPMTHRTNYLPRYFRFVAAALALLNPKIPATINCFESYAPSGLEA